jgi:coenzyme F420 hydrogenase subunit beta
MKTFFDLIQEVQKPGLCHRCGGCVTFCSAINYGALEIDAEGKPRYGEIEKCIECGLCHAICPEIGELEKETRERVGWAPPIGRVIEATVARAADPAVRNSATDGGVVTALLLHLLERGRIDGAIVTKQTGAFRRRPFLATSTEDIKAAAGFFFDTSHGMKAFSDRYMTYAQIEELNPMLKKGLRRVAFVGTGCQIRAVRRMQILGVVPSDAVQFCLGLFCSGNFTFDEPQRRRLSEVGGFAWEDVRKVNIKEHLLVHLTSGEIRCIPLEDLEFMRRHACRYCPDYSAEFADLSFGGIGAEAGWTTVITRSPLGRAAFADTAGAGKLEQVSVRANPSYATQALAKVRSWSAKKRKHAQNHRKQLAAKGVAIKSGAA